MEELAPEPRLTQEDFIVRKYALEIARATVQVTNGTSQIDDLMPTAREIYDYMTGNDAILDQSNEDDAKMELPFPAENVIYLDGGPNSKDA